MFLAYTTRMIFFIAFFFAVKPATCQSSATTSASATIVSEQDLSIKENFNFENNIITREYPPVSLTAQGTTEYKMIASYTISDYAYAVTIPKESIIIKRIEGTESFSANLTLQPACTGQADLCSPLIIMGAIFNTSKDLPAGNYTSLAPCNITINYN